MDSSIRKTFISDLALVELKDRQIYKIILQTGKYFADYSSYTSQC